MFIIVVKEMRLTLAGDVAIAAPAVVPPAITHTGAQDAPVVVLYKLTHATTKCRLAHTTATSCSEVRAVAGTQRANPY